MNLFWPRPQLAFDRALTAGGEDPVPAVAQGWPGFAVYTLAGDAQNSITVALHADEGKTPPGSICGTKRRGRHSRSALRLSKAACSR